MTVAPARKWITGGILFEVDQEDDIPRRRDILLEGDTIVGVNAPGEASAYSVEGAEVIDATDRMIVPGFVNAHYHSYDVLAKGLLEDMPFDIWALHSQPPYYGPRSKAELRMRVLIGAIECLRNGITTVQDMNTLVPQDEETLDIILAAYAEVGIRVVFSIALRDIGALDIAPFLSSGVPKAVLAHVQGTDRDPLPDLAFVEAQINRRRDLPSTISWGLSPSGPQRSSRTLLEGIGDIGRRHGLPIFTHVYETKTQTAKARALYAAQGGSMIRWLDEVGLLGPRTSLAHCVWLRQDEMTLLAERQTSVAHNPISNMKLKSGVAPMRTLKCEGVNVALGCDNSSCGDCQNMFQAMKSYCLLSAVSDPLPTGIRATDAIHAATLGGARALGLDRSIGVLKPGMKADLMIIDLSDPAYMPFNNATRQLVFSESGRGVETTIVNGRVVMRDRKMTTVNEAELRGELADLMVKFRHDHALVAAAGEAAQPWLLDALSRVTQHDIGIERLFRNGDN